MKYYNSKTLNVNFSDAVKIVTEELTKEGFGLISKLDLKEKFQEKLNVSYSNYLILGVCQPDLAFKALEIESHIGVLLPCNVVIRQLEESTTEVFAIDPTATISMIGDPTLGEVADTINNRLKNVLENI